MATAPLITRVPPEHRLKLLTPLGVEAMSALRAMGANKLLRPVMSEETTAELVDAGYVHETFGGPVLSDIGQVRSAMENGQ